MSDATVRFSFDFGAGPVSAARFAVRPDTVYPGAGGYGLDLGSEVWVRAGTGCLSSDRPFFFSLDVPQGDYDVTIVVGGAEAESVTTVRAESRRLMLESVRAAPGERVRRSFTVNVRNALLAPPPESAPGGLRVLLKDREQGALHWDDKLTLEFRGRPCVSSLEITSAPEATTVFLAGDSTVTDQPAAPYASWGQMLPRFFRRGVSVANHAESGETLKSFITELRLAKLLSLIRAGDYLLVQFGHNDEKEQWPQTYVEASTTYKAYLRVFVAEARLRGAVPVLVTSMHRRAFGPDRKIINSHGRYPEAVREVAREDGLPLVDLHEMSARLYEALGPEESPRAFAGNGSDMTHHSGYGAYELAKCVVEGIRAAGLDLARYVVEGLPAFDPSRPDPIEGFPVLTEEGT